MAGLLGDQFEHHEAQVAVVEEPAHAAAATARAAMETMMRPAVEAERVTAMMLVAVTAPVAAVGVLMSSKHVCFRSYFVISKQ
jgi:hypothetical protein